MTGELSLTVGGYWGPRPEAVTEAAATVARTLAALGAIDDALGQWYQLADTLEQARSQPVSPDPARLERLLLEGRNRTDAPADLLAVRRALNERVRSG